MNRHVVPAHWLRLIIGCSLALFVGVSQARAATPVAGAAMFTTVVNGSVNVQLPGSDADAGDTLAFGADLPLHGVLTVDPETGAGVYVPNEGFVGTDEVTYAVSDGTEVANGRLYVAVHDAPVAGFDATNLTDFALPGVNVGIDLSTNQDGAFTYALASLPAHGVVAIADGKADYVSFPGYTGSDTFSYYAITADGQVSSTGTVTLEVVHGAVAHPYVTGVARNGWTEGFFNVQFESGQFVSATIVQAPGHGQVATYSTGYFRYTPVRDFIGTDTFTYRVSNGSVESNISTVTVLVQRVNESPVITASVKMLTATAPAVIGVTASVSDPDGAISTYEVRLNGVKITSARRFTHIILRPGSYTLHFVAVDNEGMERLVQRLITVKAPPEYAIGGPPTVAAKTTSINGVLVGTACVVNYANTRSAKTTCRTAVASQVSTSRTICPTHRFAVTMRPVTARVRWDLFNPTTRTFSVNPTGSRLVRPCITVAGFKGVTSAPAAIRATPFSLSASVRAVTVGVTLRSGTLLKQTTLPSALR